MQYCPKCEAPYQTEAIQALGVRHYTCTKCMHVASTVEVPEHYLRELVMNSIKLASLVKLPEA